MLGTACFFNWFLVKKSVKREISGQFSVKAPYNRTTIFPKRNGFLLYQLHLVFRCFFVKKEEQNVRFQTNYRHYYGLWSPPLRFLEYLYAQFDYLHRLFCKLGVNSVNIKDLFAPFTLNVSVNGLNMKIVYITTELYGADISLPGV